jgi:hypothetical protein
MTPDDAVDYTLFLSKLLDDIRAEFKSGATDDEIAAWSEAYACTKADLVALVRLLSKPPDRLFTFTEVP